MSKRRAGTAERSERFPRRHQPENTCELKRRAGGGSALQAGAGSTTLQYLLSSVVREFCLGAVVEARAAMGGEWRQQGREQLAVMSSMLSVRQALLAEEHSSLFEPADMSDLDDSDTIGDDAYTYESLMQCLPVMAADTNDTSLTPSRKRARPLSPATQAEHTAQVSTCTLKQLQPDAESIQSIPGAPVDEDELELLRELADLTGGRTVAESLRAAVCRIKGMATHLASATPAGPQTPPTTRSKHTTPIKLSEPVTEQLPESMSQESGFDYARVMDSHGFGLVLMDTQGNFLHWNKTMERVLGYERAQMQQLSMMHVTPAEDLPAMMQLMPRLLGGPNQPPTIASPVHLTKRCVTRSGEHLSFNVRMSVMPAAHAPMVMRSPSEKVISCLVDCHDPRTWAFPSHSGLCAFGATAARDFRACRPTVAAPAAAGGSGGTTIVQTDPGLVSNRFSSNAHSRCSSQKSKTRVPLPRQAVAELRELLHVSRYPELAARQAISQRYGLDRRRVDRWLENTRARQVAREKAQAAASASS